MSKYLLGYDVGSSSVKATILHIETGIPEASATSPKVEMKIMSPLPGYAEQRPELWWEHIVNATKDLKAISRFSESDIAAIGISYQMHGLVLVDKNHKVLRPSIIWCDSRAVGLGEKAFNEIGRKKCLSHMLNSPGNFTASKLKWVKDNEPDIYDRIYKFMLPGDYIAMKLTGEIQTTVSGLSEGILWDFKIESLSDIVMNSFGFDASMVPDVVPTFSNQGSLSSIAAKQLGLKEGIPISYRAGDQPNNALSLNVLKKGEIAATAGTSGVIYGISDLAKYDLQSRVNTFVHVNHTAENPKYGVLLCVNGTGIQNSWLKHNVTDMDYQEMNNEAENVPIGSEGLLTFPFGNGAERILGNLEPGGSVMGLDFNRHSRSHLLRSAQEGIVFALKYGFEIMENMGMEIDVVRAGEANMFLSPIFREAFVNTNQVVLEICNTDGSQGAARGAGIGGNIYSGFSEAFIGLKINKKYEPDQNPSKEYNEVYINWLNELKKQIV